MKTATLLLLTVVTLCCGQPARAGLFEKLCQRSRKMCCAPVITRPCRPHVCTHQRQCCPDTCCADAGGCCEFTDCSAPALCPPCGESTCSAPVACSPCPDVPQCQTGDCCVPDCSAPCVQGNCCTECGNPAGTHRCCCSNSEERCEIARLIRQSQTACYALQRKNAIHHLGDYYDGNCHPEIVAALICGLNDSDHRVRAKAADEIGDQLRSGRCCCRPDIIEALKYTMADCDPGVRRQAEEALQACGFKIVDGCCHGHPRCHAKCCAVRHQRPALTAEELAPIQTAPESISTIDSPQDGAISVTSSCDDPFLTATAIPSHQRPEPTEESEDAAQTVGVTEAVPGSGHPPGDETQPETTTQYFPARIHQRLGLADE